MAKIREEEYIEILKLMEATSTYPAKAKEIHEKLIEVYGDNAPKAAHTVDRALKNLLGNTEEEIDSLRDEHGIGYKEIGTDWLGFEKKNKKITGYWYKKKVVEEAPGAFSRFLADAVIYSKVLNPEFKPDYYANLQSIFGAGEVKKINEYEQEIIDFKPYSIDGGIDVMQNVLKIQRAIDTHKKITFILRVYQYNGISLEMSSGHKRCVSPYQLMMSNGRYYLLAKNKKAENSAAYLPYRVDLMDEIEILENERIDETERKDWKDPQKFMTANPFLYFGEKEDVVIGFEEQEITQVVDWFGTEENELYKILGSYYSQKPVKRNHEINMDEVKMLKLKFPDVNIMAFSFWVMQYMDCVEMIEGDKLKSLVKERMEWALAHRIK